MKRLTHLLLAAFASAGTPAAMSATVATIQLPAGADAARFQWGPRADGRYELRVARQAEVRLAKDLSPSIRFESIPAGDDVTLVFALPADSGVIALTAQGGQLVVSQVPAVKPPAPAGAVPPVLASAQPAAATGAPAPAPPASAAASKLKEQVEKLLASKLKPIDGLDDFRVDMSVPTSPAFTVLGGTPETILRPTSPRDLAVSLVDGVNDSSKLGKGIGFDITPFMLWWGKETTLAAYQESRALPVAANAQLSFGAVKADGGDDRKATRIALGLTLPLIDEGDPRAKDSVLAKCFATAANELLGLDSRTVPDWVIRTLRGMKAGESATSAELAAELSARHDTCRAQFRRLTWSATRWTLGLAGSRTDRDGESRPGTYGLWTTYSHDLTPFFQGARSKDEDTGRTQALLHLRQMGREEVADDAATGTFRLRRGTLAAAGLRHGSEKRNFSIEASVYRARYDDGERELSRKLAVGGELMINKDFWLVLSVGGEGGLKNGKSSPFALAALKFGSASEPTGVFAPKP